jgi:hypothetical protein
MSSSFMGDGRRRGATWYDAHVLPRVDWENDMHRQIDTASLDCQRQVHELYDEPLSEETRRDRLIAVVADFTAAVRRIAMEAVSKTS